MVIRLCTLSMLLAAPAPERPRRPTPAPPRKTRPAPKPNLWACPAGTVFQMRTSSRGKIHYCVLTTPDGKTLRAGPLIQYQHNGKVVGTGSYRLGKRHGRFVTYDSRGNKHKLMEYANGKRHGLWKRWGENRRLLKRGQFKHGLAHGPWKTFHPTGWLQSKVTYRDGKRHGQAIWYHPNGVARRAGLYAAGQLDKCWNTWDNRKRRRSTLCYLGGRLHGTAWRWSSDRQSVCNRRYHRGIATTGWHCPKSPAPRAYSGLLPATGMRPKDPPATLEKAWTHPTGWGIGIHFTGFFPYGKWTDHAYAGTLAPADLDQIQPGGGAMLELGRKWRRASLFFQVDVAGLAATAWKRWAASQGSSIRTTLVQYGFHLALGVDLFHVGKFRYALRLGLGLMQVTGKEKNLDSGDSHRLRLMRPSFSTRFGMVGGYELANGYELLMFLDQTVAVPGVKYGNETARTSLALTLGVGIRFWAKRQ